jgi:hypothetical protein
VMLELGGEGLIVVLASVNGASRLTTAGELLPGGFRFDP